MSCTHPYGKNIKKSVLQDIKNLKTPFDQGGCIFYTNPVGVNLDIWKFQYRHPPPPIPIWISFSKIDTHPQTAFTNPYQLQISLER